MIKTKLRWRRMQGGLKGECFAVYTLVGIVNPNGSWSIDGRGGDMCGFMGFEDAPEAAKLACERKARAVLGIIRWREAVRATKEESHAD